jgi:hypothetical protein
MRTHIMIHHSLTSDGFTVSWPAIRRFHVDTNQWLDIGYHYGLESVDDPGATKDSLEVLVGRTEDKFAAACPEGRMNELAIHICVVGNFDLAPPSDELLDVLARRCVRSLMARYALHAGCIVGHRDYNPKKSCPGKLFDLERLRRLCR